MGAAMTELSGAHVKYLTAIYEMSRAGQSVSSADVARLLNVSRPSVTRMLMVLNDKGMTSKARYGKIALTEEGLRVARQVENRTGRIALLLRKEMNLTHGEAMAAANAVAAALPERILPAEI